jgi:hypothetical protein
VETVYIETTIVSYLAAEPSRDLVTAGRQQARPGTFGTWRTRKSCAGLNGKPSAVAGNCRRFARRWSLWETRRMNSNPILEEVWRIKEELAREADYDLHRMCENVRKWVSEHPPSGPVAGEAETLRQLAEERSSLTLKESPPEPEF